MNSNELTARFGDPVATYGPSPGQTFAGVLVTGGAATLMFAIAVFGFGFDGTNRICGGLLGLGAVVLGYWIYRQRRWRLAIFSEGIVQVRSGGVDEVLWSEVKEVIHTRFRGMQDPTLRLEIVGAEKRTVVSPINIRSRARLFAKLLEVVGQRGIPVRVEWEESD
jgi:hypothetical protein